jgi:hypothetical protein
MTIETNLMFEHRGWATMPNIADKEQEAALALSLLTPTKKNSAKCESKKLVRSVKKSKTKKSTTKKTKSNKIKIPVYDIIRHMTIPQPMAAEQLGVSISTLKRRYYELDWGRWPINSANGDENEKEFIASKNLSSQDKLKIENIINERNTDEAIIDPLTMKILNCTFQNIEV